MLETELFGLLDHTADAAFVISDEGEIQYWNKPAQHLLGYSEKDVRHRSCCEILEGTGALGTRVCHEGCSIIECAGNKSDIPNFDMNVKTASGERVWINVSTLIFDNPRNGRRLLVHLAHDISQQKKTEQLVHKVLDLSHELSELGEMEVRPSPASPLSEQEKHVLRLFAEGKNSTEIAEALRISLQTLRNHLHHINQKLRTHNRLEAVMNAIQRKLI